MSVRLQELEKDLAASAESWEGKNATNNKS